MGYIFGLEEELLMLIPGLISGIPTGLFSIAAYILTAMALYTVSRRRGLNHAWLAWIPAANMWLLGSISDQYRYVVKGENKTKRKWLLVLSILKSVLVLGILVYAVVMVGTALNLGLHGGFRQEGMMDIIGPVLTILGLVLPFAAIAITSCVIRYMALFDIYRSMDPGNAVLYLVLSILFSPTEPFFLFFNREKDLGMPPRKQPVYEQANSYENADL